MKDESNKRFKFGENWKNYLASINDEKITLSKVAISNFLKIDNKLISLPQSMDKFENLEIITGNLFKL